MGKQSVSNNPFRPGKEKVKGCPGRNTDIVSTSPETGAQENVIRNFRGKFTKPNINIMTPEQEYQAFPLKDMTPEMVAKRRRAQDRGIEITQ